MPAKEPGPPCKQVGLASQVTTIIVLEASAILGRTAHPGIVGTLIGMLVVGMPIVLAIRWATRNYPFDLR